MNYFKIENPFHEEKTVRNGFTTSVFGDMTINDETGDYILHEKCKGRDIYKVYMAGFTFSKLVGTYDLYEKGMERALQRLEEIHGQRKNDPSKFKFA